jgi:hypothetical protein
MTICVGVRVAEGLVLAADSAVVLQGVAKGPQGRPQSVLLQTFAYGNKVARVKDYPIGVMSWGLGSIEARSIPSLIMEFEHGYADLQSNPRYSVRKVADDLLSFIKTRYVAAFPKPTPLQGLGMYVGGFSAEEFFSSQYVCQLPRDHDWTALHPDRKDGSKQFGASWWGQEEPLARLFRGVSGPAIQELVRRGADKAIVEKWVTDGVAAQRLVFDGMPLQDAVDFAEFAVQVTIGSFRFAAGPPLVGGEIDIAVLRPGTFQWARRKQWTIKD